MYRHLTWAALVSSHFVWAIVSFTICFACCLWEIRTCSYKILPASGAYIYSLSLSLFLSLSLSGRELTPGSLGSGVLCIVMKRHMFGSSVLNMKCPLFSPYPLLFSVKVHFNMHISIPMTEKLAHTHVYCIVNLYFGEQ